MIFEYKKMKLHLQLSFHKLLKVSGTIGWKHLFSDF